MKLVGLQMVRDVLEEAGFPEGTLHSPGFNLSPSANRISFVDVKHSGSPEDVELQMLDDYEKALRNAGVVVGRMLFTVYVDGIKEE